MTEKIKIGIKNKIAASSAGFLIIILGLAYFIVIPTITEIKTMGDNIERQRADLEKKYIKGQSLRQLMENFKKIETKLELLDKIFVNKNRELEFITSLENEANKNKIGQKINLSAPKAADNQNFQKIKLQLATEGAFMRQLKYLMNLESLNYYINVQSLELSSAQGRGQAVPSNENGGQEAQAVSASENEGGLINMSISADTYWE